MKKRNRKRRSRNRKPAATKPALPSALEAAEKRADQAQNKYDILGDDERRQRRSSAVEYGNEETQIPAHQRLRAISFLRDLERNFTQAKSMIRQLVDNVIGQKVQLNTDDATWNEDAAWWFNSVFSADVYARDDCHLDDFNATLYASTIREHDCILWFDAGGVLERGKFVAWESDQIASLTDSDWTKHRKDVAKILGLKDSNKLDQNTGVIRENGVVKGWFVHAGRGLTAIDYKDATVIPRGPGRLLKRRFRIHQDRGVASLLTSAKNLIDAGEILDAERLSAKTLAHTAMAIKCEDSHIKAIGRASSGESPSDPGPKLTDAKTTTRQNYTNFEKLCGGAIEYLERGDEIVPLPNNRPGPQIQSFVDHQGNSAGASLGLPRLYALLQANASYSAARAETNIAEKTFSKDQKWLERYVLDYELIQGINYGVATGQISAPTDPMWMYKASWDHPKVAPIDRLKNSKADTQDLKNGTANLADLNGPGWKKRVDQDVEIEKYRREEMAKLPPVEGAEPVDGEALKQSLKAELIEELKEELIEELKDQLQQEIIPDA